MHVIFPLDFVFLDPTARVQKKYTFKYSDKEYELTSSSSRNFSIRVVRLCRYLYMCLSKVVLIASARNLNIHTYIHTHTYTYKHTYTNYSCVLTYNFCYAVFCVIAFNATIFYRVYISFPDGMKTI